MAVADDLLTFNGVDGATGAYSLPPMTAAELAGLLRGEEAPENLRDLRFRHERQGLRHLGVKEGVDAQRLDQAGWGVIFAQESDPAIREALQPLLDLRRSQAGDLFRIYEAAAGCRPGESKAQFLARHGVGPGPADPAKVPYYLLLVGSPESIPFRFQTQLDVQYAVGRLHFERTEDYARYAASVVAAEAGTIRQTRRMAFLGVENAGDVATDRMTRHLVEPLIRKLSQARPDWQVTGFLRAEATKARLAGLLGGNDTPALLFTAGHGLGFPPGDPRQRAHQGALVCSDWPGPESWKAAIPQDFYFAGDDLAAGASLQGLVSFHFACYGAGTPHLDEFAKRAFKDRAAIAPAPFLGALPQALLGHPRGGALAVIGHVERAWGYSFLWKGAGAQTTAFESTLTRLLDGHPVGSALEYLNARYAELSTMLADRLEDMDAGARPDPTELAGLWTANNDARGYVILGDPAVRLPAAGVATRGDLSRGPVEESISTEAEGLDLGAVPFSLGVRPEPAGRTEDAVQISAWHPRALAVEETAKLLVYAHLFSAVGAVASDAGQILGQAVAGYRTAEASPATSLAPGTEILIVPRGEGLLFDPPQARLTWSGAWQRADFTMSATGARAGHVIEGSIACYVGPLLIADLRLPVVVPRPGAVRGPQVNEPAHQSARLYQAVFASYAHADTPLVEAMEKACKALGMDYLRDVMTLKTGQRWSDELLRMIEQADVFQLFWSTPASQSPYVEQEWRHALGLAGSKGPAFIRPIYWEKPLPPVPAPLRSLHFAPVDLPGLPAAPQAAVPALLHSVPGPDGEDLTTFTVSTWAGADPGDPTTGDLKARTRISLTGDVETRQSSDPADAHHLERHERLVAAALKARLAYLEVLSRQRG